MKANLVIAASVIAVLVTWDILWILPLPLGVAGHEGSAVIVGLNGLRLLRAAAWRRAGTDDGAHTQAAARPSPSKNPHPPRESDGPSQENQGCRFAARCQTLSGTTPPSGPATSDQENQQQASTSAFRRRLTADLVNVGLPLQIATTLLAAFGPIALRRVRRRRRLDRAGATHGSGSGVPAPGCLRSG